MTEILLKVALNTIKQIKSNQIFTYTKPCKAKKKEKKKKYMVYLNIVNKCYIFRIINCLI